MNRSSRTPARDSIPLVCDFVKPRTAPARGGWLISPRAGRFDGRRTLSRFVSLPRFGENCENPAVEIQSASQSVANPAAMRTCTRIDASDKVVVSVPRRYKAFTTRAECGINAISRVSSLPSGLSILRCYRCYRFLMHRHISPRISANPRRPINPLS